MDLRLQELQRLGYSGNKAAAIVDQEFKTFIDAGLAVRGDSLLKAKTREAQKSDEVRPKESKVQKAPRKVPPKMMPTPWSGLGKLPKR
jgi:hypothetical protein